MTPALILLALWLLSRSKAATLAPAGAGVHPVVSPVPTPPKAGAAPPKSGGGLSLGSGAGGGGAAPGGSASVSQLPAWMQPLTDYRGNQVQQISDTSVNLGTIASVAAPTYSAPDQSSWIDQAISAGTGSGNSADSTPFNTDDSSSSSSYSWGGTFDYSGGDGAYEDYYF